jgi:cation:H+ antiporter
VAIAILLVLGGAAILALGGETTLRGSVRSIVGWRGGRRVPPAALGAVLLGLNIPSLGAIVVGAAEGHPSIAAGAAFGTIALVGGLAFGVALLASKAPAQAPNPVMTLLPLGALLIAAVTIQDLVISRGEGVALVAAYVAYLSLLLRLPPEASVLEERGASEERAAERWAAGLGSPKAVIGPGWLQAVVGLALVAGGAALLVGGASRIGDRAGLASGYVGAAIVGSLAGASKIAPEVRAIRHGGSHLAAANVAGTVAVFSTGALGVAALIRPLVIDSSVAVACVAVALLYVVAATVLLASGRAGRWTGVALLVLFGAWLAIGSRF